MAASRLSCSITQGECGRALSLTYPFTFSWLPLSLCTFARMTATATQCVSGVCNYKYGSGSHESCPWSRGAVCSHAVDISCTSRITGAECADRTRIIALGLYMPILSPRLASFMACRLQRVSLASNNLHGSLNTSSWQSMVSLRYLNLSSNQITGVLPAAWSVFRTNISIDVSHNNITGPLPDGLSAVGSDGLTLQLSLLNVSYNQLTGRWQQLCWWCEQQCMCDTLLHQLPPESPASFWQWSMFCYVPIEVETGSSLIGVCHRASSN